jgi:hypothetical protein
MTRPTSSGWPTGWPKTERCRPTAKLCDMALAVRYRVEIKTGNNILENHDFETTESRDGRYHFYFHIMESKGSVWLDGVKVEEVLK